MRFLEKLRIKKRAKTKLKTESQIRQRRRELYEIRRNWIENGEKNISDIDAVIAEFNWILGEEEKQQDSSSELQRAKAQIKELEEQNRKLQIEINIARRD
jgi:hypothetical protein